MVENDFELINKFLENELSEEEARVFKIKYDREPDFAREVNIRSGIYISLDTASRVSKKVISEKPFLMRFMQTGGVSEKKHSNFRSFYSYAAVVLLIIALGIILMLVLKPKHNPAYLYAAYFHPPESEISKGISNEEIPDFSGLLEKIDRTVAAGIDTLQTAEECFFFGIYCMENQRFIEAAYAFTRLINSRTNKYREESEWYLGLCYLKTGKKEEAIKAFSEIAAAESHVYQRESARLLRRLN